MEKKREKEKIKIKIGADVCGEKNGENGGWKEKEVNLGRLLRMGVELHRGGKREKIGGWPFRNFFGEEREEWEGKRKGKENKVKIKK